MNDQRPTVLVIMFLGMIGVGAVLILMMISLEDMQMTPAGTLSKLGNAVTEKFKPESMTIAFRAEEDSQVIDLRYMTRAHVSGEEVEDEMRRMAEFVREEMLQYKDEPILRTRQIAVKRTELYGSGCFQSKYENDFTLDVPERKATELVPPLNP